MNYDTVYKAEYKLTPPEEHPPVTAPPGGHIYGNILLDKFKLRCIYGTLLNDIAGHSYGHKI